MREYKFRGRRIDNGEWVYGAFIPDATEPTHGDMVTWGFIRRHNRGVGKMETIEVDRETVGQLTGLKDKNGNEIYEGDIVVDRWANEYTPVFQNGIYMAYNPKHLTQNGPSTQFNVIWKEGCEVIGNIHDQED